MANAVSPEPRGRKKVSIMDLDTPTLFNRPDTLLGVCQGLADDLGINALWLRLPLAGGILFNPYAAIGTYFGLGLLVLASRLLFPVKSADSAPVAVTEPGSRPPMEVTEQDQHQVELSRAA